MTASGNGKTELVKALIQAGSNLNDSNKRGVSSLFWAASKGHSQVCEVLLQAGAVVDASNVDGRTPLITGSDNLAVVEVLLQHNADMYHKTMSGNSALSRAAFMGKTNVVNLLITKATDAEMFKRMGCERALKEAKDM